MRRIVFLILLVTLFATPKLTIAQGSYAVYPISTPVGWTSVTVYELNDVGEFVGSGITPSGTRQAFIGTVNESTPIPLPNDCLETNGVSINDIGLVAGTCTRDDDSPQAFIGTIFESTLVPLTNSNPGYWWNCTYGLGLNNFDWVVGWGSVSWEGGSSVGGFAGTADASISLILPPLDPVANFLWEAWVCRSINDAGDTACYGWDTNDRFLAFIGSTSQRGAYLPSPAGFYYHEPRMSDINNSGQVTGYWYHQTFDDRAFVGDTDNGLTPIPTILGWSSMDAASINDVGQVVGHACCISQGWTWDAVNGTRSLNTMVPSDWHIDTPVSINNMGEILVQYARNRETYWTGPVLLVPIPNQPPEANAGSDQTVDADSGCNATVIIDGTGSYDPDEDTLTYTWTGPFGTASGPTPTVTLPLGTHTVTLTVDDGNSGSDIDIVTITVVDTTPPELSVSVSPDTLWPPNHKMMLCTPTIIVSDNCDPNPAVHLISVTSNESNENYTYDPAFDMSTNEGHTDDDIQIVNGDIYLRCERSANGDGRIYTITYEATDFSGNTARASATVTVPHNH